MMFLAYNYIKKEALCSCDFINEILNASDLDVSHAGKTDPPKKFTGNINDLKQMIMNGDGLTNYTFLRDKGRKIELTIEMRGDERWEFSTISIGGPGREDVESISLSIVDSIGSFLAISGHSGGGKGQTWKTLHKNNDCPERLLEKIG